MSAKTTTRRAAPTAASSDVGLNITTPVATAIFFALSLVYFLPAFLPGKHLFGTDYLAGGYFFYDFVSRGLDAGAMPGWVPYIYGGLPLAANPGSAFYPVRLLADFLFPVAWILPFIFVVQFGLAGLGMYLLARELKCRSWVALVAGLAFEFTGITVSSVYAGHDGRVIVATYAPLLFYFLHRGIRTGALSSFAGAAATIGFSLLSFQIQNNYYLLGAAAIWTVFALIHLGIVRRPSQLAIRSALSVAAVAFGFGMAAVNYLPFIDYIPESPRGAEGGRGYDYSVSWSMPPAEILALAVPESAGILDNYTGANPFKLHTEYVGVVVFALLVLGFKFSRSDKYWWFFLGLSVFALSIAFGGHTPLYRLYFDLLPGTNRFRAPSLSFFIVALSLVGMAAITLERMAAQRDESEDSGALKPWLVGLVGIAILAVVAAIASSAGQNPARVAGYVRFAFFTALASGVLWLWWTARLKTRGAAILLCVLTVADLWIIDRNFFETVPPPDQMFAQDDVALFLAGQPGRPRVWVLPPPPGTAPGGPSTAYANYLMMYDIDQAGGEHPNQLQHYNQFVGPGETSYVDYHNLEVPNFLNAAGIRFLVSMAELNVPFLREVHRGGALIYENLGALPRAYLVGDVVATPDTTAALTALAAASFNPAQTAIVYGSAPQLPGGPVVGSAEILEYEPDQVTIRAQSDRPALLVLSDNFLAGWSATVDGVDSPILRTNHTFRGVVVEPGAHDVVFRYHPSDLYMGFYIYIAFLSVLAGYGIWLLWSRRRVSAAPA